MTEDIKKRFSSYRAIGDFSLIDCVSFERYRDMQQAEAKFKKLVSFADKVIQGTEWCDSEYIEMTLDGYKYIREVWGK